MKLARMAKMGHQMAQDLWLKQRPFLLYFKPTARCDLRCTTCERWTHQGNKEEELSLAQIEELLGTFRRAGCMVVTMWGGEPTLRSDLPQILRHAKELGYRTSICSNCNQLARKVDKIVPHLDVLLCSLDGVGEVHDQIRGVEGLFDRVVAGIEAARGGYPGCDIKIWATVQQRNVHQIEELARLARDLDVGLEYFPLSPIQGYNDELLLDEDELAAAFGRIRALKQAGWPVRNPDRVLEIMQHSERFACNFGRISIHVDHCGRVYSCEDPRGDPLHAWGPLESFDPERVFGSPQFKQVASELRGCQHCRLPCVVELANNLPLALASMALRSIER
jgi:MoaA/NifB/PqqE/SkfB family radical SAM enzyme